MKTFHFLGLIISVVIAFSSCATQNLLVQTKPAEERSRKVDSAFRYDSSYQYKIRKYDKISISIWDHDDLSVGSLYGIYNSNEVYGKWLMLDAEGNVIVPKIGRISLYDLTVIQARKKLEDEYKKWLVNPIIEIKVLNKEITILGELKTPGKFLLEKDNNSLLDIIGKAGDFDFYANKTKIQIIRPMKDSAMVLTVDLTKMDNYASANIHIQPGDIINVPSRKGKVWDKRAGSVIVPIATVISSFVLLGTFVL
jgi:polysaccharide biosynthesis/export protein